MACGACSKRRAAMKAPGKKDYMNGYEYMQPTQVKARLETFKRKFCGACEQRYDCNLNMYLKCDKKNN